ncbi:MAG: hypothetical protein NTW50_00935 [Candidatus Berkelbacteria bacterium]|nr:hypothetical protein [Candidatus Berkelbacteria bacterium]
MGQRLETGYLQNGDDWRGVYLRGDDAFGFSIAIKSFIETCELTGVDTTRLDLRAIQALQTLFAGVKESIPVVVQRVNIGEIVVEDLRQTDPQCQIKFGI